LAEHLPTYAAGRTTVVPWKLPLRSLRVGGPNWVGSVSSPMQEAAVRLLDGATVSSPSHCGRRTQSFPTAALADKGVLVVNKRMAGYGGGADA
jgi:hypothetical protein